MLKQSIWLLIIALVFGFVSYKSVLWLRRNISWHTYVVQSGSMEPSIGTGDVIFIAEQSEYQLNDTITFKDANSRTVTHRITQKNETPTGVEFITKGDANQTIDAEPVPATQVIGKVAMVVPRFGYVIQFGRTPWGFILFFIVPTVIILYDEIKSIISETRGSLIGKRRRRM